MLRLGKTTLRLFSRLYSTAAPAEYDIKKALHTGSIIKRAFKQENFELVRETAYEYMSSGQPLPNDTVKFMLGQCKVRDDVLGQCLISHVIAGLR